MNHPNNKETVKRLYKEYKEQFINELYDTPLEFKKNNNSYTIYKENGDELAFFTFRFEYNIDNSPIDYKKYKLNKYWDINWYWSSNVKEKEKNTKNFIKVTSTAFKVVDDFIRNNNYPALLGFGGLTEKHEQIYSNQSFIDRWKILFGEKYYVEWKNNKLWIINKNFYQIDELRLIKHSQFQEKPISEIYRMLLYPNKNNVKGISRHNLIKEQIKRIILKKIYIC
jgi:hypothetical protein